MCPVQFPRSTRGDGEDADQRASGLLVLAQTPYCLLTKSGLGANLAEYAATEKSGEHILHFREAPDEGVW